MNCSAPELHFSTRFFGSWPQKRRIASGPILVPVGRISLWLILLPDGKIEWPVPVPTPRASLSLVPPLPGHPQDKLQRVRNRRLKVLILQGGRWLVKRHKHSCEKLLNPIIKINYFSKPVKQRQWKREKFLQNSFRGCDATWIDHI